MKYAIALTGGIATGKSVVASMLQNKGYFVIDADKIAHNVLELQATKIIEVFGNEILRDGQIDRKKLGNIVFNDKNKRFILNDLLHPKIRAEILESMEIEESKNKFYFVDIPLFFETKAYNIDRILLIYASKKMQIERIMRRNNLSKKNAIKRIQSQMSIEKKKNLATDIIENTGDLTELEKKVDIFLAKLGGL